MRLSDENLRGRPVIAADGQVIGEIAGLFFEAASLRVDALLVKLRKEAADRLGAERSWLHSGTLEVPIHQVQSVGDTIVLSVATSALRPVPAAVPSTT